MPKVKTITLDGTETAVKFEKGYPYYVITNMGDGELYASGSPGITAYADGVYTILPGMETRISPELSADTVYLLGSGTVQVRAEEIAVPTSFNPAGKGGGSGGTTDYTQLENKPSINSVDLIGNKTLEELGINNFDGKYINLSGAPVKCTVINNVISGWVRFCIIEKAPVSGTMIINVSRQNRTAANNGEAFSFMGVLSYNLCNSRKEASFKILNACGIGSEIPTTRVIVPDNPEWRNIYIDFLTDSIYGLPVNCEMFFDPEMFKNSTITCPMAQYPPSIDTVNHKHYTFENKVKEISVDSALSETSENPVQNKVVTEALADKADKSAVVSGIKGEAETEYRSGEVNITKENIGVCKNIGVFAGTGYSTVGSVRGKISEWCYRAEALTTVARCIIPVTAANSLATPTEDDDNVDVPENDALTVLYINPLGGYHAADGTVANGLYMLTSVSYGAEFIRFPLYGVSRADDGLHPEREGYTLNADGTYT